MSSATITFEPKDTLLSTKSMVVRFAVIALVSSFVYWLFADSDLKKRSSPWWVWIGHAGTLPEVLSQSLAILAIILGGFLLVALVRIKRGKALASITSFDRHVAYFAVYEELNRWFLWLLWLTVASDAKWLHWLLTPLVGIGGITTFGILGSHVGSHDAVYMGAAILASIRVTRGPESTNWLSRLTGSYIGVLMFVLVFNPILGIICGITFRVTLYLLVFRLKRFLGRFED